MKISTVFIFFFATVLFYGFNPMLCSSTKSGSKILPGIFDVFSVKKSAMNPVINFNLEENTNFGLRQTLYNEQKRNMRRNFADFQELRQNDLLRFQDLMVVQNEQLSMIKNIIMPFQ